MKIIFDENLPPTLARGFKELFTKKHDITCVFDKFGIGVKDIELFKKLDEEGEWVLISGDRHMTRNLAEKQAIKNSKIVAFYMCKSIFEAKYLKKIERLIVLWEKIEETAKTARKGSLYELPLRSDKLREL